MLYTAYGWVVNFYKTTRASGFYFSIFDSIYVRISS